MTSTDPDITTTLFDGIRLSSCVFNASGVWCTEVDQLQTVLSSPSTGAVISKSCTLNPRTGNTLPRYFDKIPQMDLCSINSMGIPNHGIEYYMKASLTLDRTGQSKPFILSISGLDVEENLKLFSLTDSTDNRIDAIEFNLSCPNIIGKPQTGLDFDAMDNTLRKVFEVYPSGQHSKPVGLKLPPYFDFAHFQRAIDVIDNYSSKLSFLTCINSIGNGLAIDIDSESTVIHPKNGFGGLGGDIVKFTALANVRQFYVGLGHKLDIIGCGGVKSGSDVFEHILCGAKAVQIGTLIQKNGVAEFDRVTSELKQIMKQKQYTSTDQYRGKLKTIEAQ